MKLKNLLISSLLIAGSVFNLSGQVTIGSLEDPTDISVLELISDDSTQPRGLRLPLLDADEISILASNINHMDAEHKAKSNGMMVYNTTISCVMIWNGTEFKSLCGDLAPAEISLDCSTIEVFPQPGAALEYQQGVALDGSSSYIKLYATVGKPGTYNIKATTGNGYSFSTSGTLLDVGRYELKLAGAGTPIMGGDPPQQHYDEITLSVNDKEVTTGGCDPSSLPKIPVKAAVGKAGFTLDCSQSNVSGSYIVGNQLGSGNYITVRVTFTSVGFYSFTAEAGGMRFTQSGQATSIGTENINLLSSGTPTAAGTIPITIIGEGDGGQVTCDKEITVAYRSIKILGYGTAAYQPCGVESFRYSSKIIPTSEANFGLSGTFPTQNISYANGSGTVLSSAIAAHNPDIIIIGYPVHPSVTDNAVLLDFIKNKKGVVMAFTQDNGPADAAMINTLCETSGISVGVTSGGGAAGSVYRFENVDNPILNGPFGDVRNLHWGEDAATTYSVSAVPAGATLLSERNTAFVYNNSFLWIGDGGFMAGNRSDTSPTAFPCKVDTNGKPIPKPNYSQPVYNSVLYANALAWAIDYVQKNR